MPDALAFLPPDGPCGDDIRARDWAATPLGDPSGWPDALRQFLASMVSAEQAMFLAWGEDLTFFFNDPYRPFLGARAAGAMGRPFAELWSDIWADIEPIVRKALAGEGSRFEDFPLTMLRNGYPEETWWTFSYNPLRDAEGAVRGMWCATMDASARVVAERHARAERARLDVMLAQAPGFFALLEGPDHRVAVVNDAAIQVSGGRPLLGRTVAESLPEAVAQGFVALLDRVRATGEAYVARGARLALAPHPGAAAEDRHLDFVYQPVRDAEGRVASIVVAGNDVTESHLAAEALGESEGRFRALFEALDESVVIMERRGTDAEGRSDYGYVMANRAARDSFGLDDAVGRSTRAQRPEADEDWYRAFDRVLATGEPERIERRSEATGRVFEAYLARVGEPPRPRLMTVTRDVTAQRDAQDVLRRANETLERRVEERTAEVRLLARIVETTDAFIQAADGEFRWLAVNRAAADEFERIYGARPAVGLSMLDLLADRPEHQAAVRAVWGRALAGEEFTERGEFGDPALDRRTYEMRFNVLPGPDGRPAGAFQIVTDVTDRLRAEARLAEAEAQLRQAQKMEAIGQLTGGVAHDFNNLLTPILGGLDILARGGAEGPRAARVIEGAAQSAERARVLVSRLLAFARRQPLEVGAVDLAALLGGLRGLVESTVGPRVRVRVEVGAGLPPALGDANQLEMAVLNLAANARDAMPEGGEVTLSARAEAVGPGHAPGLALGLAPGSYLRLAVADTGEGMDEATRARAAEPFFSTKGVGKGTGLGLSMAHGLAAQLGGALAIESAPGRGTEVALWLPVAGGGAPDAAPPPEPPSSRPGRALLVDDEALVREATAGMLRDLGWEVVEAGSGAEALAVVEGGTVPDVLVTDHLMPDMTGTELARRLRRGRPSLGVLVVSGFAAPEAAEAAFPRLAKPFRRDELARRLLDLGRDRRGA